MTRDAAGPNWGGGGRGLIVVPFEITATDGQPVEQTTDILIPSSAITAVNVWTN